VGKLKALYKWHKVLMREFEKRGHQHHAFFDKRLARGKAKQDVFINTIKEQKEILRRKSCSCFSDSIKNKNKAV
jgi:hypothetical protein